MSEYENEQLRVKASEILTRVQLALHQAERDGCRLIPGRFKIFVATDILQAIKAWAGLFDWPDVPDSEARLLGFDLVEDAELYEGAIHIRYEIAA